MRNQPSQPKALTLLKLTILVMLLVPNRAKITMKKSFENRTVLNTDVFRATLEDHFEGEGLTFSTPSKDGVEIKPPLNKGASTSATYYSIKSEKSSRVSDDHIVQLSDNRSLTLIKIVEKPLNLSMEKKINVLPDTDEYKDAICHDFYIDSRDVHVLCINKNFVTIAHFPNFLPQNAVNSLQSSADSKDDPNSYGLGQAPANPISKYELKTTAELRLRENARLTLHTTEDSKKYLWVYRPKDVKATTVLRGPITSTVKDFESIDLTKAELKFQEDTQLISLSSRGNDLIIFSSQDTLFISTIQAYPNLSGSFKTQGFEKRENLGTFDRSEIDHSSNNTITVFTPRGAIMIDYDDSKFSYYVKSENKIWLGNKTDKLSIESLMSIPSETKDKNLLFFTTMYTTNGTRSGFGVFDERTNVTKFMNTQTDTQILLDQDTIVTTDGKTIQTYDMTPGNLLTIDFARVEVPKDSQLVQIKLDVKSHASDDTFTTTLNFERMASWDEGAKFAFATQNLRVYDKSTVRLPIDSSGIYGNAPSFSLGKINPDRIEIDYTKNLETKVTLKNQGADLKVNFKSVDDDDYIAYIDGDEKNQASMWLVKCKLRAGKNECTDTSGQIRSPAKHQTFFGSYKFGNYLALIMRNHTKGMWMGIFDQDTGKQTFNYSDNTSVIEDFDFRVEEGQGRLVFVGQQVEDGQKADDSKIQLHIVDYFIDDKGKLKNEGAQAFSISSKFCPKKVFLSAEVTEEAFHEMYVLSMCPGKQVGQRNKVLKIRYKEGDNKEDDKPGIEVLNIYDLADGKDLEFCPSRAEILVFDTEKMRLTGYDLADGSEYNYPTTELEKWSPKGLHCMHHNNLAAVYGTSSDSKSYIAVYRLNTGRMPSRRVLSFSEMAGKPEGLSSGWAPSSNYVMITPTIPEKVGYTRKVLRINTQGPAISVDTTEFEPEGTNREVKIPLKMQVGKKTISKEFKLYMKKEKEEPEVKLTENKIVELKKDQIYNLDTLLQFSGPVLSSNISGNETQVSKLQFFDRKISRHDLIDSKMEVHRMEVRGKRMVVLQKNEKIAYFTDINQDKGGEKEGKNVWIDATLVQHDEFENTAGILAKSHNVTKSGNPEYLTYWPLVISDDKTSFDTSGPTVPTSKGLLRIHAEYGKKNNLLYVFGLSEDKTFFVVEVYQTEGKTLKPIQRYRMLNKMTAYFFSHFVKDGKLYIIYTNVNSVNVGLHVFEFLVDTNDSNQDTTIKGKVMAISQIFSPLDDSASGIVPRDIDCSNLEKNDFECFYHSEGIEDLMIKYTVNEEIKQEKPVVTKSTLIRGFIRPGSFEVEKVDTNKNFRGVLLKNTNVKKTTVRRLLGKVRSSLRLESTEDKKDTKDIFKCPYIILVFSKKSAYTWTGFTCQDLNLEEESTYVPDFAMGNIGRDYIWFSKRPSDSNEAAALKGYELGDMSFKVNDDEGLDLSKIKLNMEGLKNTTEFDLGKVKGEQPKPDNEPEEESGGMWWILWAILLVFLGVIIIGGLWFIWQKKQNSGDSNYSQAPDDSMISADNSGLM